MIREEGSTYQPVIALPFQHYIDNMHTAGDFIDKSIRGGPGLGGTFCDIGGYNFDFLWIDIKTYKNMLCLSESMINTVEFTIVLISNST